MVYKLAKWMQLQEISVESIGSKRCLWA